MRNRKRRRLAQENEDSIQEAPVAPVVQEEKRPEPEEATEEVTKRKSLFSKE